VLGDGELVIALTVHATSFQVGQEKITKAAAVRGVVAMLEKLANVFRIPTYASGILFTLGLLACTAGGHIPTPGVNADKLQQFLRQNKGSRLAL